MAFQYKNVLESALNKLPSRYSEQILASTCDQIDKRVSLSNEFFSYAIKPEVSELLSKTGIELAPIAFQSHTHPACKMIENYILYIVVPSLLSSLRSVAFFSLRESKANKFIEMFQVFNYGKIKSLGMYNALVDAKDAYRYSCNSYPDVKSRMSSFRNDCLSKQKFPDVLFCHDELHFWTPGDVVTFFDEIPEISKILGTIIFPVEILKGETRSKEPRIYGFEIEKGVVGLDILNEKPKSQYPDSGHFSFFPDNESSEGYRQKISSSSWCFKFSYLVIKGNRCVRVSRLKTIFSHHLFSFEVVHLKPQGDQLFFNNFSALTRKELNLIGKGYEDTVIERGTFQSICLYLSCLKTPNAASALAKLRQLEKRDLFPDEVAFVFVVAQELSKYGLGGELNLGFFKRMCNAIMIRLPEWLTGDFAAKKTFQLKMRNMMKEISEPRFAITRSVYAEVKTSTLSTPERFDVQMPRFRPDESFSDWDPVEINVSDIFKPRSIKNIIARLRRGWFVSSENFKHGPLRIELPDINDGSLSSMTGIERTDLILCKCGCKLKVSKFHGEEIPEKFISFSKHLHGKDMGFYSRDGKSHPYNGGRETSIGWPAELDQIIMMCNEDVDDYDLCLAQKCSKGGSANFQFDDESAYPKGNKVLIVNVVGDAVFEVKCRLDMKGFILRGGSFFVMPNGFQEEHKYAVKAKEGRVALTFRSSKPNHNGGSGHEVSECQVIEADQSLDLGFNVDSYSSILGTPDVDGMFGDIEISASRFSRKNSCVFDAVSRFLGVGLYDVLDDLVNMDITEDLFNKIEKDIGLTHAEIEEILACFRLNGLCTEDFKSFYRLNGRGCKDICLVIKGNHCELGDVRLFNSAHRLKTAVTPNICLPKKMIRLSIDDAKRLISSMSNGTTGVIKSTRPSEVAALNDVLKKIKRREIEREVEFSLGFPGSGKSKKVIDYIHSRPTVRRMVISPRNALKHDFESKVQGTSTTVCTFETALFKIDQTYEEVVIDEISMYPPGYLALLQICYFRKELVRFASEQELNKAASSMDVKLCKFIVLGDPLQVRYHSGLDDGILRGRSDIDIICDGRYPYLMQTFRMGSWFKEVLDIPCLEDGSKLDIKYHSDMSTVNLSLISAVMTADQESKGSFIGEKPVYTYSEAEGLTFDEKTIIVINSSTFKTSTNAIIVALTRSRKGFEFVLQGVTMRELKYLAAKSILSFVFNKKQIPMERIKNLIPGADFTRSDFIGSLEDKAKFDPFILPSVDLTEDDTPADVDSDELTEPPEWFKTHICQFDANPLIDEIFEKMADKEKREFRSLMSQSNQFGDLEKGLLKDECFPMQFQSIFPRHEAMDDETFWAGVKKRLHFSTAVKERRKFDEVESLGVPLANYFLNHLPGEFKVTNDDIIAGSIDFNKKRAEKTEKLWENHMNRSDIDWNLDRIFLFMKSQTCTKEGKMFTTAKAGQTLACFQHVVLFKFGPMLRAIERAFIRAVGESYYIHSGKNFFCLDSFVKRNRHLFDGKSVESDYESFDSCQDHVILAFEVELLKRLGVSHQWIADYKTMKMNLSCRLGGLAIMRFTGEFCTFLFNTFANMLFTFLKYKVDKNKDRILFAGDDMASLKFLEKRTDIKCAELKLLSKFSLKAIEEIKEVPMFCGWYLSPFGILKSPRLLWARICMMKQRDLLKTCVDNYLFETIFAYRLGDRLYHVLKSEDIEYHHCVTRFFIKNSKLLKGQSVQLLQEIGECIGMSLVKVNEFMHSVENKDLKIEAIQSREIYSDASFLNPRVLQSIKRFESNVKVSADGPESLIISDFQLLDEQEIKSITSSRGEYNYLHFGAILGCITPMFPNYETFGGTITVYDGHCLDPKYAHIASFGFNFQNGPAYFVFRPGHVIATTDANMAGRFRIKIDFDCPKYDKETEIFGIDMGVMYRLSNTSRFLKDAYGASGWSSQAIQGCEVLNYSEEIGELLKAPAKTMFLKDIGNDMGTTKRGLLMPNRSSRRRRYKAEKTPAKLGRSASFKIERKGWSDNESSRRSFTDSSQASESFSLEADDRQGGKISAQGSSFHPRGSILSPTRGG